MFRYLWLDVPGGPAVSTAAAAAGDEISWNFDMVLLAPTEKAEGPGAALSICASRSHRSGK